MAHKLPIHIRRHYSYRPTRNGWTLTCDTCGGAFNLPKSPPGQPIGENGLRMLMAHTQIHLNPPGTRLYTVAYTGDQTKAELVSHMPPEQQVEKVYEVPGGHVVHVHAANLGHARVKARGVFNAHFHPNTPGRHHWRHNPRT